MSEGVPEIGTLRTPGSPLRAAGQPAAADAEGPRELFVRHARKDSRSVAVLRAIDYGDSCVVEAEVYPQGGGAPTHPGPYTFANAHEATAFVTEAVEALMYLGCEIAAE